MLLKLHNHLMIINTFCRYVKLFTICWTLLFSLPAISLAQEKLASDDPSSHIPFKQENTSVNDALSTITIFLFIIFVIAVALYFINKKYGFLRQFSSNDGAQEVVTIHKIKRITNNTVYVHITAGDVEYKFIESKVSIHIIDKDSK